MRNIVADARAVRVNKVCDEPLGDGVERQVPLQVRGDAVGVVRWSSAAPSIAVPDDIARLVAADLSRNLPACESCQDIRRLVITCEPPSSNRSGLGHALSFRWQYS